MPRKDLRSSAKKDHCVGALAFIRLLVSIRLRAFASLTNQTKYKYHLVSFISSPLLISNTYGHNNWPALATLRDILNILQCEMCGVYAKRRLIAIARGAKGTKKNPKCQEV